MNKEHDQESRVFGVCVWELFVTSVTKLTDADLWRRLKAAHWPLVMTDGSLKSTKRETEVGYQGNPRLRMKRFRGVTQRAQHRSGPLSG